MSLASTTVYLYAGLDNARRATPGEPWPASPGGHVELVDWLETCAMVLDSLYDNEFAELNLGCVFDYDITEALGAWLYENGGWLVDDFRAEARRLVAVEVAAEAALAAVRNKP